MWRTDKIMFGPSRQTQVAAGVGKVNTLYNSRQNNEDSIGRIVLPNKQGPTRENTSFADRQKGVFLIMSDFIKQAHFSNPLDVFPKNCRDANRYGAAVDID
jgi:hypothetical protein